MTILRRTFAGSFLLVLLVAGAAPATAQETATPSDSGAAASRGCFRGFVGGMLLGIASSVVMINPEGANPHGDDGFLFSMSLVGGGALGCAWQRSASVDPGPARRFSVFVGPASHPAMDRGARDVEAAMIRSGFDQEGGGCSWFGCVPPVYYPQRGGRAPMGTLGIAARLTSVVSAELLASGASTYAVTGHTDPDQLIVESGGTVYAALLRASAGPVRIGAGPALLRRSFTYRTSEIDAGTVRRASATGGMLEAALVARPRGRVFAELRGQYRSFGAVKMPSHRAEDGTVLESAMVESRHAMMSAGAGVRF